MRSRNGRISPFMSSLHEMGYKTPFPGCKNRYFLDFRLNYLNIRIFTFFCMSNGLPMDLKARNFFGIRKMSWNDGKIECKKMQSRVLNLILSQRHEDLHADRIVQNVAENRKTIWTLAFYKL